MGGDHHVRHVDVVWQSRVKFLRRWSEIISVPWPNESTMPGSPDPVFRNDLLKGAITIAIVAAGAAVVLNADRILEGIPRLATWIADGTLRSVEWISEGSLLTVLGVSVLYGLVLVGAWLGLLLLLSGVGRLLRVLSGAPPGEGWLPLDSSDLSLTLKAGFVGLFAQTAVPLYLYARWSLVGPFAVWVAGTAAAILIYSNLGGGETPGPYIYTRLGVPVVVASAVVVAILEVAVRVLG